MSHQPELNFDHPTGEQLKLIGLDQVSDHAANWLKEARSIALNVWRKHGEVCADDIRPCIRAPHHPNAWVAVFKSGWKSIGWKKSTTVSNHARMIRVWVNSKEDK